MQSIKSIFNHFRETVANGKYIFLSNVLEKITFFLLFAFFARRLSTDYFGIITTSFAVANIISSVFEGGFNFYLQRAVATRKSDILEKTNQIFTLRILLGVPYFIFGMGYFLFYPNTSILLSSIILVTVVLFSINNLCNSIYFGMHKFEISFRILFFSRAIMMASFFIISTISNSAEILVCSFLFGAIIHTIMLIRALKNDDFLLKLTSIKWSTIQPILKSSLPMGIGMIFVWIYDRGDTVLIQNFLGFTAVAFYGAAYSVYKAPQAFANFILTPSFTEFSKLFSVLGFIPGKTFLKKIIILLIVSFVFAIGIFFSAEILIPLFFSSNYGNSILLLMILVFALPGLILNNLTGVVLNAAMREKDVTFSLILAAIFNIVLNVILLVYFRSLVVVAIVTVLTEYFSFFFQLFYIFKRQLLNFTYEHA